MSTKIKTEDHQNCYSFQCTSEIILETDVVKTEEDKYYGYEENDESPEIQSHNIHSGQLKNFQEMIEVSIEEVMNIKPTVAFLTKPPPLIWIKNDKRKCGPALNENNNFKEMVQKHQTNDNLKRKRELTNARVKKHREKKHIESQQLNSAIKGDMQKKLAKENNIEHKRAMSKERSRRYRERKRLNALKSAYHLVRDS